MSVLGKMFRRKKKRKYPIKRDEFGQTARQRCFEMFEEKMPFEKIAEATGVAYETAYKYHQQWSVKPEIEKEIAYFKGLLNTSAPDRDSSIDLMAKLYGISKEQFETLLHQPSGLKRLLSGKIYLPAHAEAAHKQYVALELAVLIADHLVKNGGKFEDVYFAFEGWMKKYQVYREEDDEDTVEENKQILFMRSIIKAGVENERRRGVQSEQLSDQERETVIKWRMQLEAKQTEIIYWLKIAEAMAGGISMEEAREKIYQDLLRSGDVQGAKVMREYQDKIHPLKTDKPLTPQTPEPPSNP